MVGLFLAWPWIDWCKNFSNVTPIDNFKRNIWKRYFLTFLEPNICQQYCLCDSDLKNSDFTSTPFLQFKTRMFFMVSGNCPSRKIVPGQLSPGLLAPLDDCSGTITPKIIDKYAPAFRMICRLHNCDKENCPPKTSSQG